VNPPYPGLKYKIEGGKEFWEGPLSFVARFDSVRVKDTFKICIELSPEPGEFPLVMENGGRIESLLARGKAKRAVDLHVNPNSTICFCPKPEERRRFHGVLDLKRFIQELVIPYFFALHQFEKTEKWIWGQYSHGHLGIMEYYFDHKSDNDTALLQDCLKAMGFASGKVMENKVQLNGHEKCPCGSGLKFKKCHPMALAGLKAIIKDYFNSDQS